MFCFVSCFYIFIFCFTVCFFCVLLSFLWTVVRADFFCFSVPAIFLLVSEFDLMPCLLMLLRGVTVIVAAWSRSYWWSDFGTWGSRRWHWLWDGCSWGEEMSPWRDGSRQDVRCSMSSCCRHHSSWRNFSLRHRQHGLHWTLHNIWNTLR